MKKYFETICLLIIFCVFCIPASAVEELNDGLIVHYSFDTDTEDTVLDRSENNHTGTVYGAEYTAEGVTGGAYNFDGIDDHIIIGNLGYHPSGTISFWMNADVVENWRNPFSTDYAGWDDCIRFEESSNGDFVVGALGMGTGTYTTSLEQNKWYHVVYAWDENNGHAYLNGKPVFTAPHPDPDSSVHPDIPNTAGYWKERCINFRNAALGNGYSTSADRYWKGRLDEVRIYNRTLSASEVTDLYRACNNKTPAAVDQLGIQNAASLCYEQFLLPVYPDGLRASWGGVYSSYLPEHPDDDWYNPHNVITESTTLLAQIAAARDDEQTLSEMIDLLTDPAFHGSERFQLFQWLLDPNGYKLVLGNGYANAAGEENRMLEVLGTAASKFGNTGLRDYFYTANWIASGMKGTGEGIGNLEAPPYELVYENTNGRGGYVEFKFPGNGIEDIFFILKERMTTYGYSIIEINTFDTEGENINDLCEAYASSIEHAGMEAENCVDGNFETRWSSTSFDPQWLLLHFNEAQDLRKISVHWETAAAENVIITALNSIDYIADPAVPVGEDTFQTCISLPSSPETRFVRIILGNAAPSTLHTIAQIRVFGPDDPELNPGRRQGWTRFITGSNNL